MRLTGLCLAVFLPPQISLISSLLFWGIFSRFYEDFLSLLFLSNLLKYPNVHSVSFYTCILVKFDSNACMTYNEILNETLS
jgi:hypothetical protein